jgi:hypothetical protein
MAVSNIVFMTFIVRIILQPTRSMCFDQNVTVIGYSLTTVLIVNVTASPGKVGPSSVIRTDNPYDLCCRRFECVPGARIGPDQKEDRSRLSCYILRPPFTLGTILYRNDKEIGKLREDPTITGRIDFRGSG